MKSTNTLIAVLFAASLALVSCAKQDAIENGSTSPADGVRTIAVSFANSSTKSTLDGFQPKFIAGDEIKVSNGSKAETCTVEIEGDVASITTSLTGALTMVYPSTAAKMNGNAIDGILVPTVQDGTFASANICKAEIAVGATSATFENQTAVFCITPGAGASTKYVEVITAGAEIANSVPEGSEYDTMHKIHVASASAAPVYVSILVPEGLRIRDLSFADGSNMKTLKDDTGAIAVNSLYTITNQNWNRPYVDLQMTVGDKTRTYKWATMNVGATSPEDYGDYFMWGAVEKAYSSVDVTKTSGAFTFGTKPASYEGKNMTWDASKGFSCENALYTDGVYSTSKKNVFTKYTGSKNEYAKSGTADGKTTLELEDDAANVNWGGSWRMPTIAELQALFATNKRWDATNKGYTFGVSPAQIFLPGAGYGLGTVLRNAGDCGYYWSSSLTTSLPDSATEADFRSGNVFMFMNNSRYYGQSVRPLSD